MPKRGVCSARIFWRRRERTLSRRPRSIRQGLTVDDLSARLRSEHGATLLAISRDHQTFVNPSTDFVLEPGDDGLVVAESLGKLQPLRPDRAMPAPA